MTFSYNDFIVLLCSTMFSLELPGSFSLVTDRSVHMKLSAHQTGAPKCG